MRDTSWRFRTIHASSRRIAELPSHFATIIETHSRSLFAARLSQWRYGLGKHLNHGMRGIYNGCIRKWNMHRLIELPNGHSWISGRPIGMATHEVGASYMYVSQKMPSTLWSRRDRLGCERPQMKERNVCVVRSESADPRLPTPRQHCSRGVYKPASVPRYRRDLPHAWSA